MTKADVIFKENIKKIMEEGVFSENARPVYQSGGQANSKYVTGAFAEYDLSKGEFPITTLRPIPIKSAIREIFWIYQDQTNDLSVLMINTMSNIGMTGKLTTLERLANVMVLLSKNTTLSVKY